MLIGLYEIDMSANTNFVKTKFIDNKVVLFLKSAIPYIGLIVVVLFFQIVTKGRLLTAGNLGTIFNQTFTTLLGASGIAYVIAQGNLDLSLGSIAGFSAVTSVVIGTQFGVAMSVVIAIITGGLIGLMTGSIHVVFRAPATILTICMQFLFRGLVNVTTLEGKFVPLSWSWIDSRPVKIAIMFIVVILSILFFEFTKLGKYSKAIGSGELASLQVGIPVGKYKIIGFIISGAVAGFCGFFMALRAGSVAPTTGVAFEMDVLLAIVLGGMPLSGGATAKIRAAFLGSITLAFLMNGLIVWGISDTVQQGIKGAILLISATASYERSNMEVIK